MKAVLLLAFICAAVLGSPPDRDMPRYLFVWAGDAAMMESDFLAVIDVTPGDPTYEDERGSDRAAYPLPAARNGSRSALPALTLRH